MSFLGDLFGPPNIAKLETARDLPGLSRVLRSHKDSSIRRDAADALRRIRDPRAIDALLAALDDEDAIVRLSSSEALGGLGTAAVEPLLGALAIRNARIRCEAAWALGKIGDPRALEPLLALVGDMFTQTPAREAIAKISAASTKGLASPATAAPSKREWTLLEVCLSAMPTATQVQQRARFAAVAGNLEFGLFVPLPAVDSLASEAMRQGFTVWANADATTAFLYGAGSVTPDAFTTLMNWLRGAATSNQKIQVGIHNEGEPTKLIEVAV